MQIIVPQNPLYAETLANIPFWWGNLQKDRCDPIHLIQDSSGLMRPVSDRAAIEYVMGGELEEELTAVEEQAAVESLCQAFT